MSNPVNIVATATPGVTRGCGYRKTGGVYVECGLVPFAASYRELEYWVTDLPFPYRPDHKLGVTLVTDAEGVTHIVDWVGGNNYPHVADFLEEARQYGFSRRVTTRLDFARLTPASRLIFVHARAVVTNARDLTVQHPEYALHCGSYYRGDAPHDSHTECSNVHWCVAPATHVAVEVNEELYIQEFDSEDFVAVAPLQVRHAGPLRQFAGSYYPVNPLTEDSPLPEFMPGVFASVPITNIAVVQSDDGTHEKTAAKIRAQLDNNGLNVMTTLA